jgi:penicillin-binding protein A
MAGPRAKRINIPLRRVALVCAAMLFASLANITYIQAFQSGALNLDPRNQRALIDRFEHPRGDILTTEGEPVATSVKQSGGPYAYQRLYPGGEVYASVTGYQSLYDETGIEHTEDEVLSGDDPKVKVRALVKDGVADGADVQLTISARVQLAAYEALRASGRRGAAVAVNPETGAVLALVSHPSYDPNAYTGFDPDALADADRLLRADPQQPLLNRALARHYPPGAAFGIITSAAALSSGAYTMSVKVDAPTRLALPGASTQVANAGGAACGDGYPQLVYAFQVSCDTAFAGIGLDLGQESLRRQAERFGFNADDLEVPLAVAESVYPKGMDRAQTALSAIGRFEVRVTPLMLAMMAAAVANQGALMRPYLVEEARLPDGSVINRATPGEYRSALSAAAANEIAAMMAAVARPSGTGAGVAVPGITVAAKTGASAGVAGAPDHATVVAFAPAEDPEVAVSVLLEQSDVTTVAAITRAVIQAALDRP